MNNIIFIIISVSLSGLAQLALKYGLDGKIFSFSCSMLLSLLSNIFIWLGLLCYLLSMLLRFKVLSEFDVSFAYPFMALSFIIVTVGGFFLGEQISGYKILGILSILFGIFLLTRG